MRRWKEILVTGLLIIAAGLFVRLVGGVDNARASTESTPPNAIPVTCQTAVGVGTTTTLNCTRTDDRSTLTTVPTDHYLLVTDIQINRNTLASSGDFYATIGRASTGILPASPNLSFSGTPLQTTAYHYQAPYIVLQGGESLSVRNDSSSDFPLNVYTSGFLVTDVTYHVLFQNYLPGIRSAE